MFFRCYKIEYFAKDKLLSNLLKDECDTPFAMYSDVCFYLMKFLSREIGVLQTSHLFFPTSAQITLGGGQIFLHSTMSSFNSVCHPAPKM